MDETQNNFTGLLCIEAQEEPTVATESTNSGGTIIFLVVSVGIGGKTPS